MGAGQATPQEYKKETGKTIEKLHGAPIFRTLVTTGEIPPVSERRPEEPLVIMPVESIGEYSGRLTLLQWMAGGWEGPPVFITFYENLIGRGEDARILVPNIVKDGTLGARFLRKRKIKGDILISHRFSLDKIKDAFELMIDTSVFF